jgi:hypothetical protein
LGGLRPANVSIPQNSSPAMMPTVTQAVSTQAHPVSTQEGYQYPGIKSAYPGPCRDRSLRQPATRHQSRASRHRTWPRVTRGMTPPGICDILPGKEPAPKQPQRNGPAPRRFTLNKSSLKGAINAELVCFLVAQD